MRKGRYPPRMDRVRQAGQGTGNFRGNVKYAKRLLASANFYLSADNRCAAD